MSAALYKEGRDSGMDRNFGILGHCQCLFWSELCLALFIRMVWRWSPCAQPTLALDALEGLAAFGTTPGVALSARHTQCPCTLCSLT